MAAHFITGGTLDPTGKYIETFTISGDPVPWPRFRVWRKACEGDTFTTLGPTPFSVVFPRAAIQGKPDPLLICTSDVAATATSDTLTGVTVAPNATGNAVKGA